MLIQKVTTNINSSKITMFYFNKLCTKIYVTFVLLRAIDVLEKVFVALKRAVVPQRVVYAHSSGSVSVASSVLIHLSEYSERY